MLYECVRALVRTSIRELKINGGSGWLHVRGGKEARAAKARRLDERERERAGRETGRETGGREDNKRDQTCHGQPAAPATRRLKVKIHVQTVGQRRAPWILCPVTYNPNISHTRHI